MLQSYKKVLSLLTPVERRPFYLLMMFAAIMAFVEMGGIASIYPFLSVISNQELIYTNAILRWLYENMGFADVKDFLYALGFGTFLIIFLTNLLRSIFSWTLIRFKLNKEYVFSNKLFKHYLYEAYPFFLTRNSTELIVNTYTHTNQAVNGLLGSFLEIFTQILVASTVVMLLFVTDPKLTILLTLALGGAYFLIYILIKNKLTAIGKKIVTLNIDLVSIAREAFEAIKDVKCRGKEEFYIERQSNLFKDYIKCAFSQQVFHQFPSYLLETLIFGGILLITFYVISIKDSFQQIVPLIGLYALAARRLMGAFGKVYEQISSVRCSTAALEAIFPDFCKIEHDSYMKIYDKHSSKLPFSTSIELRNLVFQYSGAKKPAINNLSLTIRVNTTIGFVGSTGAGKTTTIDILLGLLLPEGGALLVDNVTINKNNLSAWQRNIGYVPQHIYLSDETINRNIAFATQESDIDHKRVEEAARLANIHDFIVRELPMAYETKVGERGVRLSGGQRQRIGIARALYHNPSIIVLDEATSALDGITENVLMEAIHSLAHRKTIILVAHRLTTVKECDMIYFLENGKLVDQGTYESLMETNLQFRKMAKS